MDENRWDGIVTRECTSKRRFMTLDAIEHEISMIARYEHQELRWYQCNHCHGFHLTSNLPRNT